MQPVGYRTGQETDRGRTAWDGRAARPLAWAAWYPADPDDPSGPPPTGKVTEDTAFLFTDNPGVDRAAVHDAVFGIVLAALGKS